MTPLELGTRDKSVGLTVKSGGSAMKKKGIVLIFMSLLLAVVLSWGIDRGWAQTPKSDPKINKELKYRGGKVTPAERKAAVKRVQALGLKPGVAGKAVTAPTEPEPGADSGTIGNKK
jgi:hypothetical protein